MKKKPVLNQQLSEVLAMLPPMQAKFALNLCNGDNASEAARQV